jgi:putative methyltransferase (TIGR04325 family)
VRIALRKIVEASLPPVLFDALLRLRDTALRRAREGLDIPGVRITTREQQLLAAATMPLLACALKRRARVLDFGGGLGSDFRRVREMMPSDWSLVWEILETLPMAEAGRKYISEAGLRFFSDWQDAHGTYDLVLASSSIQYTSDPVLTFERLTSISSRYMIVTRLPLFRGPRDRLTVQRVSPSYYDASYPAWFLGEEKWLPLIEQQFVIRRRWDVPEDHLLLDGQSVINRGLLLERRQ